jgi:Pyruvate kinase, barrel domain
MFESMVGHEHTARAEVTDVVNAVLDGSDAVMLYQYIVPKYRNRAAGIHCQPFSRAGRIIVEAGD